jgi:hypothetical protein
VIGGEMMASQGAECKVIGAVFGALISPFYHGIEKGYGAGKGNFQPMIATAPTLASRGERVHPLPAIRAVK